VLECHWRFWRGLRFAVIKDPIRARLQLTRAGVYAADKISPGLRLCTRGVRSSGGAVDGRVKYLSVGARPRYAGAGGEGSRRTVEDCTTARRRTTGITGRLCSRPAATQRPDGHVRWAGKNSSVPGTMDQNTYGSPVPSLALHGARARAC
jgi:hypothetical protein